MNPPQVRITDWINRAGSDSIQPLACIGGANAADQSARAFPILEHPRRQGALPKMIKTFSLSALFFLTVGMLLATHATLPF
jgi:hypothetical protein